MRVIDDFPIPLAVSVHSNVPAQLVLCSTFADSLHHWYDAACCCCYLILDTLTPSLPRTWQYCCDVRCHTKTAVIWYDVRFSFILLYEFLIILEMISTKISKYNILLMCLWTACFFHVKYLFIIWLLCNYIIYYIYYNIYNIVITYIIIYSSW